MNKESLHQAQANEAAGIARILDTMSNQMYLDDEAKKALGTAAHHFYKLAHFRRMFPEFVPEEVSLIVLGTLNNEFVGVLRYGEPVAP